MGQVNSSMVKGNSDLPRVCSPRRTCYFWLLTFYFALSASLSACGYQFQVEGPGPVIGGAPVEAAQAEAPRLAILNFENKTFEPNLEMKYTSYARQEFSVGTGARLVNDLGEADLIFKGQIVWVIMPAIAFTQSETFESRVTVRVEATVEDVKSRKVVWKQGSTGSSEFFVSTNLQFNRVLQDRALEQAGIMIATDLAARFHAYLESSAQATPPGSAPAGPEIPPLRPSGER